MWAHLSLSLPTHTAPTHPLTSPPLFSRVLCSSSSSSFSKLRRISILLNASRGRVSSTKITRCVAAASTLSTPSHLLSPTLPPSTPSHLTLPTLPLPSDKQGCIDLIEKSPTGVLRVLDEACKKPGSDADKKDKSFCTEVAEKHRRNDFFMDARGEQQASTQRQAAPPLSSHTYVSLVLSLQAPGRRTIGSRRPLPSDTSRATSATLEPVSVTRTTTHYIRISSTSAAMVGILCSPACLLPRRGLRRRIPSTRSRAALLIS